MTLLERAIAVATVTLLALHTRAEAQTNPASTTAVITGHVVDSASKAPIAVANVELTATGAAAVVARGATSSDGFFRVEGLRPGRYSVRVRALGYTPRPLPSIEVGPSSSSIDLGTVALNAAPVRLQSLQVTGQKQELDTSELLKTQLDLALRGLQVRPELSARPPSRRKNSRSS